MNIISVSDNLTDVQVKAIDAAVTKVASDWVRLSFSLYIVWSANDVPTMTTNLLVDLTRALPDGDLQLLISPIDPQTAPGGFLYPWVWKWINERKLQLDPNQPFVSMSASDFYSAGITPPLGLA